MSETLFDAAMQVVLVLLVGVPAAGLYFAVKHRQAATGIVKAIFGFLGKRQ